MSLISNPQNATNFCSKSKKCVVNRSCRGMYGDWIGTLEERANINFSYLPRLLKYEFGYKAKESIGLPLYTGIREKSAGFSTESGGYGGGWIFANIDVPVSTNGVSTCALFVALDRSNGKQLFFHVHPDTKIASISDLLKNKIPNFTEINIMPGCRPLTNTTVNNILCAVYDVNKQAEINYYHMCSSNPEVVSVSGKLSYIDNPSDVLTFTETHNYCY